MDIRDFAEAARRYASEGPSVTEQFDAIMEGEALAEQNPNALTYIASMLRDISGVERGDDVADQIDAFLALPEDSDERDDFVLNL